MEASIKLEWLQIDNALIGVTRQPVVLCPTPIDLGARAAAQGHTLSDGAQRFVVRAKNEPAIALTVLKQKSTVRIDNYDLVRIKLRELSLELETTLLLELLRFAQDAFTDDVAAGASSSSGERGRGGGAGSATPRGRGVGGEDARVVMLDSDEDASEELLRLSDLIWPVENSVDASTDADANAEGGDAETEEESSFDGDKLFYFKALQIERIVVHITVRTNPNTDLDSVISADNLAMRPVKIMAGWLLKTLGNIDDALLQFSEFSVANLRDKQSVVQAVVEDFYVGIAKYQVLVLLGGAFPLGNPISMFSDLGKGAMTVCCVCAGPVSFAFLPKTTSLTASLSLSLSASPRAHRCFGPPRNASWKPICSAA
jgi:hypothetical protein